MVSDAFERMRSHREATLRQLQSAVASERFACGSHKETIFKILGLEQSGTILHSYIADEHGAALTADFLNRFNDSRKRKRLRFLTVIHQNLGLDENRILESVVDLKDRNSGIFMDKKIGFFSGACEVELESIDLLEKYEEKYDDTKRKLAVHRVIGNGLSGTVASVHCHLIVELGINVAVAENLLLAELKKHWSGIYQVHMTGISKSYASKAKSLFENLKDIARYLTKCGNEELKFKLNFGRDYEDDLDSKMFKKLGRKLIDSKDISDDGSCFSEKILSGAEIKFLDRVYRRLMNQRGDERGYLIFGV